MRTDFGYFEEKQLGKPYDVKLLRRLLPYTTPYKRLLVYSILLVILITLLDLSLPYVTKIAIDRYIVPQPAPARHINTDVSEEKTRYLKTDITDPKIKGVVVKYPGRFKIFESYATISFENLNKLDKKDLVILRQNDLKGVALITVIFLAIILINFIFNFVQVMVMEYSGQMIMHDLRVHLFDHIQRLSVEFFTHNPVGRLVTRVTNDTQNMHELFTSVIVFVFKDLFLLAGISLVLISINWQLALVSFLVLPFVIFASIRFADQAREAFRDLRIIIAEINTKFSETIGGITILQLFLQEKANYNRFKDLNHDHYLAGMRQIHVFAIFMPVIELLGAVAIAVVIFYGGGSVLSEKISLGALVAFISYMRMFFRPIRDIAEKYNILQNAMASAERIFLVLDSKEKLTTFTSVDQSAPIKSEPTLGTISEISLQNIFFAYVKNETVLKDVSFSVNAGETFAIVGPTGSGKTSIINLIMRFYEPTSGQILLNGINLKQIDASAFREKMALVTQDPFLFSETIRYNITLGNSKISEDALKQILTASHCKDLVDQLPQGVDTVLSEGGASISSGERQLISIARAFARNPDLIILDEATSYIDSATEHKIQKALANLMVRRTAIVVAHRLSTARKADRIIVLNRGQIIETGTHEKLMSQMGFYFKLHQLQS
jgi:ATP-binding cassette, subfamily B, multidrug efflux pump